MENWFGSVETERIRFNSIKCVCVYESVSVWVLFLVRNREEILNFIDETWEFDSVYYTHTVYHVCERASNRVYVPMVWQFEDMVDCILWKRDLYNKFIKTYACTHTYKLSKWETA